MILCIHLTLNLKLYKFYDTHHESEKLTKGNSKT